MCMFVWMRLVMALLFDYLGLWLIMVMKIDALFRSLINSSSRNVSILPATVDQWVEQQQSQQHQRIPAKQVRRFLERGNGYLYPF